MKKVNSQGTQSSQGFQTPNEKYDAEFGVENTGIKQQNQQGQQGQQK